MFFEERLAEDINFGSGFGSEFNVQVTRTLVNRYAVLRSPYPLYRFSLSFDNKKMALQIEKTVDLFNRVGGVFGGFRVKHRAEFTTNNYVDEPTIGDGRCSLVSEAARTWQIVRWYKGQSDAYAASTPRRIIRKPVDGTVLVGVEDENGTVSKAPSGWSVDNTTGIITLPVNKNYTITNITQAAQAVVTIGAHTLTTDDSVVFSGVVGMVEINGVRVNIVSTGASTITVDIATTLFTAYSSAGEVDNNPQDGEYLTAGCEFDIPVAFATDLSGIDWINKLQSGDFLMSAGIELEEIRNPEAL